MPVGSDPEDPTITQLLQRWNRGERAAAAELMPLVYKELRQIASRSFRRERPDHTLQPTALVHEVYLKLVEHTEIKWQNRLHFYGLAACMMRRALVDYSREKAYRKRGGGLRKVPLDDLQGYHRARPRDLIALDDALTDLSRLDPQKALIVELRFFGGLTVDQTAECIGLSPRSVARQWRRARAVLYHQLNREAQGAA
ncbi:MAG: sigma-70 family RNA polymerase sigma factor [Thermoanaerobaculia bacterium]